MKAIIAVLCLYLFIPCVIKAQDENPDPKQQLEYNQWRSEFIDEVSSVQNPLMEFNAIYEGIRSNKNLSFVERYQQCRKLIRLAYTDQVKGQIDYPQVLRVLGNYFWKEYNDTILAATLQLESNRLTIEDNLTFDDIGRIHSMATNSLFANFKNDREAALNILWPSAYLFGCHGLATRMICDLASSYFHQNDFLAANYYQQRAELWKNAYVNDANTNLAIVVNRELEIYDELSKRNSIYLQSVFQSDLTPLAQQTREYILPVMEATQNDDIVSAYYFREIGIDYMNKQELSYAVHFFSRAANGFKNSNLSKSDLLFCSNTYYFLGMSFRNLGQFQNAKLAFSNTLETLKRYDGLTMTEMLAKIMLAQTMLDADEEYSALKLINELQDFLLNEDASYYLDFLPNIGFDFTTRQQCLIVPFLVFLQTKGSCLIGEDDEKAANCFLGVQALLENYQMQDSYTYYHNKVDIARQFVTLNELEKAKNELNNCVSAYKKQKKVEVSDVMKAYNLLGKIASIEQKTKLMSQYYSQAYQTIVEYATSQLFTMDENERSQFWETIKTALNETMKECILHSKDDDSLAEIALNCSMFMKGLLLQSSNNLRDIVYDIGDPSLVSRYEQLILEKTCHPTRFFSEDAFNDVEELELLHDSRIINRMNQVKQNFFVKAKDIKDHLGKDDVVIEFTEIENQFNDHSIITDDKQYWAIVMTANKKPTCVQLFREKQLRSISQITDSKLYPLIWTPLNSHIDNKSNIYFSPTGAIHKFPIEYLSTPDGNIMAESYHIHRLSSIKELLNKKQTIDLSPVVLFGGLLYDVGNQTWKEWERETLPQNNHGSFQDRFRSYDKTRGAVRDELEGSKREVEFIDNLLRKNKIQCELYENDKGTEHQFRSLSGKDVKVLHLATHGFIDSSTEQSSNEYALLSQTNLWLSGAKNAILTPEIVPPGVEDGILTAREIVSVDLRSVNLVVLSACQTGMGAINSDGVFGLQRGFKKAGAKSILMSLKDVHDTPTELLMKFFYKNIYEGHLPVQTALIRAQRELRDSGYSNPEDWAAFILLDGLD